MSDSYSSQASAPFGSSMTDLVSTQKGGVQSLSRLVQGLTNAFPIATASTSPVAKAAALGSTATVVVAANPNRHGILFHVPSTTAAVLVWPSNLSPAPSTAAPGGAILVSTTVIFPSPQFPNINCGFSAVNATTTGTAPLTVWEFY